MGLPASLPTGRKPQATPKGVLLLYHTFGQKERNGIIMSKHNFTSLDITLSGEKLRSLVETSGYSVKEIQEMLCLSCPQPIYRWFHGTTFPSVDNLYLLSKILNVHMEDMLVGTVSVELYNQQDEKIIYRKQIVGILSAEIYKFLKNADTDFLKKLYRYIKTKI